jgi:LAO/AO transport system kinase
VTSAPSGGPEELAAAVRSGDRRALAQAITLVESSRADHRADANALLDALMPATGNAVRVGITGAPGAGKSTFIEVLGMQRVEAGDKLAVLAVDPSSTRTGGSILGDKTRMERLAREPLAFIRPSPSGGTLGGVARRTREAMLVCEAAACDVVIVETVGVGQSEVAVAGMVDLFLLLIAPGAGDELQGVKRGIVELADLLVVNKADGDLEAVARRTATDYASALHLGHAGEGAVPVLMASALTGTGVSEVWAAIIEAVTAADTSGARARRRAEQARAWMWSEVSDTLMDQFRADPAVRGQIDDLERAVVAAEVSPSAAAVRLLDAFRGAG